MAQENGQNKTKKSFIKKVVDILFNILLVGLGVFIIYMLFFMSKGMKNNEIPTIFNHQIYIVRSNSMSPTFETGSLIIIEQVEDKHSIKVNDIITYRGKNDSVATTHRVVDILEEETLQFVTRGDANNVDDPVPVAAEYVMGRVVFAIPYLGYLLGFMRTKQGIIVCIVTPALFIMLTQILKLIKEEKKKENKPAENKPTIEELQARVESILNKEPQQED